MKTVNKAYSYSEVFLKPNYSTVATRSNVETQVYFGERFFKVPITPANMVTCISEERAKWLSENEYFYVMHRFLPGGTRAIFEFCERAKDWKAVSISIGVKEADMALVYALPKTRCDYITIDIAHGHSIHIYKMIKLIRDVYKAHGLKSPFIIAGNVATGEGAFDLCKWGADAVKVGIGGGAACTTKNHCGFHVPMWTCVTDCVKAVEGTGVKIIADGGIRENGDIVKALAGGADFVMAGSIFASCEDAPGETIEKDGKKFKVYYGSASARNKGYKKHVEGVELQLPCNGMTYEEKLEEIKQDLQSAASYAGGYHLGALRNVEKVFV